MNYFRILDEIDNDRRDAVLAIEGAISSPDATLACKAVLLNSDKMTKTLVEARRLAARIQAKKHFRGWLVQTQLNYVMLAKRYELEADFLDESKMKRIFKKLVDLVVLVAAKIREHEEIKL